MTSRLVGLARAPQTQPNPSCSMHGCCGGTSSGRTSVRMVPLAATNFLKSTCWGAPEALFAVVPSSHVAPSRASRARQQLQLPGCIDENCKLSRRICGRNMAEVRHHCGLQQQIVVRRARKPTLSQKCRARHTAAAASEHQDCEMIEAHRLSREQLPVDTPEAIRGALGGPAFRRGPQVSEALGPRSVCSHRHTHAVLGKARCTHRPPGLRVFF